MCGVELTDELTDEVFEELGTDQGVSLNQILGGRTPFPTYILLWGENMPPHIGRALKEDGESALILNEDGKVYSMIVWNEFVGFREMSVEVMRDYNKRMRGW